MRLMRLPLVVLVAVALLLPPTTAADAAEPWTGYARTDPLDDTRTRDSLAAAAVFWGRTAPCGKVHVYRVEFDVRAAADPASCTIWIDRSMYRAANTVVMPESALSAPEIRAVFCSVVTHEYGHLLGYGHTRNFKSVMYVLGAPRETKPCVRRFAPSLLFSYGPGDFALRVL